MEPIGDILKRLSIQKSTRPAGTVVSSSRNEDPPCPRCGGAGFLRLDVPIDDPRFGELVRCDCKVRELSERRLRRLVEKSNLGAMQSKTFGSFMVGAPQRIAYQRAKQFAESPDGWLVIMGGYGTGKTHLAAAIGNYRLSLGEPALFMVVLDLLDQLRAAYAPDSDVGYDALFETVRESPLLILDDLGNQVSSQWAQDKLYQLFNHRYSLRLPTVFTTNNSLDEIGGRIASRMSDPEISYCVMIDANDFRGGSGSPGSEPQSSRPARKRQGRPSIEYTDRV